MIVFNRIRKVFMRKEKQNIFLKSVQLIIFVVCIKKWWSDSKRTKERQSKAVKS